METLTQTPDFTALSHTRDIAETIRDLTLTIGDPESERRIINRMRHDLQKNIPRCPELAGTYFQNLLFVYDFNGEPMFVYNREHTPLPATEHEFVTPDLCSVFGPAYVDKIIFTEDDYVPDGYNPQDFDLRMWDTVLNIHQEVYYNSERI
jgi:hypothetical protein